jgi:Na+-transporting methylmalonyl-CoA/oxaloacetate decarboxylase gamma subunit
MRKVFIFIMMGAFLMVFGIGAFAQEKKKEAASPEKAAAEAKKPKVAKETVVTRTATVQAIDLPNRVVTLKDEKGKVFDLKVSEKAKNLPQVKVGDVVVAKFYESIAFEVKKPGDAVGTSSTQAVTAAKPGERPAGMVANQVTVIATVEDISPKKTYVTLRGPDGKTADVKVRDPKNLENVKVGDQVIITYTEAVAISVEKPKDKAAGKPPKT